MVLYMGHSQLPDRLRHLSRHHRLHAICGKHGVGLHDGSHRQVGDLAPVGQVGVAHYPAQAGQGLHQLYAFLTGGL